MQLHNDGTQPQLDQIFVFGSNLAGVHGAGAARAALDLYHAAWGVGVGITGNCYAIPTKDFNIQTMKLSEIVKYVESFVQYTKDNPDMKFFITRIGCGLAGYKDHQIAPMFKGCGDNCSFARQWEIYLVE